MILSDREIKLALRRGHIRITPPPPESLITSTSIDLTLDAEISSWHQEEVRPGVEPRVIRPKDPEFDVTELLRRHGTTFRMGADGHVLAPWAFVLGWTAECVWLPHSSRLAARVEGRSSLARLGVGVHVTAPTIHAGFGYKTGDPSYPGTQIRLEIWNFGPLQVRLEPGMKACQLILEEVHGTPEKGYEGAFATQAPDADLPSELPPKVEGTPPRRGKSRRGR